MSTLSSSRSLIQGLTEDEVGRQRTSGQGNTVRFPISRSYARILRENILTLISASPFFGQPGFHNDLGGVNDIDAGFGDTLATHSRIELDVWDVEATQLFRRPCWWGLVTGGVRARPGSKPGPPSRTHRESLTRPLGLPQSIGCAGLSKGTPTVVVLPGPATAFARRPNAPRSLYDARTNPGRL